MSVALGISDEAYQDIQVAILTNTKLKEYLRATESAREQWEYACELIFSIEDAPSVLATVSRQQINLVEKRILQFILPVSTTNFHDSRADQ